MFIRSVYFQMFRNELVEEPMDENVLPTWDRMFEEIGYNGKHGKYSYIKCNFAHKQLIGNKHLSFCHAFTRMPEYNVFCQA